jgi:hypothetical protein
VLYADIGESIERQELGGSNKDGTRISMTISKSLNLLCIERLHCSEISVDSNIFVG